MAGDLSPLTIEADHGAPRTAPPALIVAIAVGLGTVDMPVPSIAEWEWLNWKFPRPIHAGDTLYARWTLTQKRPPAGGAPASIVVWRVDVHTADGALCAEGEVGAKVKRGGSARQPAQAIATHIPAGTPGPASPTRRRRRRPRSNGVLPEPPGVAAPPAPAAKPERATGSSRRRRRRRPGGSVAQQEEHEPRAAHVAERPAEPPAAPPPTAPPRGSGDRGIGRVLKRLRGS